METSKLLSILLVAVLCFLLPFSKATESDKNVLRTHPEITIEVLQRLIDNIRSNSDSSMDKRAGIDLGFQRGYSGSQVAKHLLGLQAANYAGGPGKRR